MTSQWSREDIRSKKEIRSRNWKAAIGVLNEPVWKCKELNRRAKLKVYNAIVVPTLMYGSETWVLNKQQESAVQARTPCIKLESDWA